MQKWIDHAISSTCNLPAGTDTETVKKVYMEAYKQGCKGFTVYVDGSRDGVLISGDCKDCIQKTEAPKRPREMDSDVYHITVKGQLYFVVVGLYKGEPYEVFAGQNGLFDRGVKKATVVKRKRGHYEAHLDDGTVIENLGDHITDEQAAITRLISLSLRHGADIKHCVCVLERVPGDMHNFGRSMARALKKYIPNGTAITGRTCDSCGSENLVREQGCVRCLDCGSSGCG
jgi:ribonucleoside-diphosphate reductase alpha chain